MQTIDKNKKFPAESLGFATGVIAVALSMGACSGIGPAVGALGALFVLLASDPDLRLPMMPVYMGFSTVSYAYAVGGTVACSAAVCFSGLLLAACAPFAEKLRRFISERSKILPRRTTGTCAMHQRQLTEAIKRARQIALLPFVTE